MKDIQFVPWTTVAFDEGLGDQQLHRLIDQGLFPRPIVIPVSSRTHQRYFPSHELSARRACLLKTDGDVLALKALITSLFEQRKSLATNALLNLVDSTGEIQ